MIIVMMIEDGCDIKICQYLERALHQITVGQLNVQYYAQMLITIDSPENTP